MSSNYPQILQGTIFRNIQNGGRSKRNKIRRGISFVLGLQPDSILMEDTFVHLFCSAESERNFAEYNNFLKILANIFSCFKIYPLELAASTWSF